MTGPPGEEERLQSPVSVESPVVVVRNAMPQMHGHRQVEVYPKEPVGLHQTRDCVQREHIFVRRQNVAKFWIQHVLQLLTSNFG